MKPPQIETPGTVGRTRVRQSRDEDQKKSGLASSTQSSPSVLLAQLNEPPLSAQKFPVQPVFNFGGTAITRSKSGASARLKYSFSSLSKSETTSPLAMFLSEGESNDVAASSSSGVKGPANRKRKISSLTSREIVNCDCGYADEDGLMIQCEVCMCWQHANCNRIEQESDVPSDYVCKICKNPKRLRSSRKFAYSQHWFTQGKLSCLDVSKPDSKALAEREQYLKKTHDVLGRLLQLKDVIHTLHMKNHILGQEIDHPKLYLWAKSWNQRKLEEEMRTANAERFNRFSGPVPEAAISTKVCRKNLDEHIDEEMDALNSCLAEMENEIDDLDVDDNISDLESLLSTDDENGDDIEESEINQQRMKNVVRSVVTQLEMAQQNSVINKCLQAST